MLEECGSGGGLQSHSVLRLCFNPELGELNGVSSRQRLRNSLLFVLHGLSEQILTNAASHKDKEVTNKVGLV